MEITIKIKTSKQEIELTPNELQELKRLFIEPNPDPVFVPYGVPENPWLDPVVPQSPWYGSETIKTC